MIQVHGATFDAAASPHDWKRKCRVPWVSQPLSDSHLSRVLPQLGQV